MGLSFKKLGKFIKNKALPAIDPTNIPPVKRGLHKLDDAVGGAKGWAQGVRYAGTAVGGVLAATGIGAPLGAALAAASNAGAAALGSAAAKQEKAKVERQVNAAIAEYEKVEAAKTPVQKALDRAKANPMLLMVAFGLVLLFLILPSDD